MRITIVHGGSAPPAHGPDLAPESPWWRLASHFVARGNQVAFVTWHGSDTTTDTVEQGVRVIRVPAPPPSRTGTFGWWQELQWGWRVQRVLPTADILVTPDNALPVWIARRRPEAGRLVVRLNRPPRRLLRCYGKVARVQAASSAVAAAAMGTVKKWATRIRVTPPPIEFATFAQAARTRSRSAEPIVLGYHGPIQPGKGLHLLLQAATRMLHREDLPLWRMEFRGPVDVNRGGGGEAFLSELLRDAERLREADQFFLHPPEVASPRRARACADLDIFCYPTQVERGDAAGIPAFEAMAARRPVVVTDLLCFRDQIQHGQTGLVLGGWKLSDAAERLERLLVSLMEDPELRQRLGAAAQAAVAALELETVADAMLADFAELCGARG